MTFSNRSGFENAGIGRRWRAGSGQFTSVHEKPVVLTFVGNYLPGYKAGGIVRTIVNTVDHLCNEFEFRIVTRDRDLGDAHPYPDMKGEHWQQVGNAMVYYLPPQSSAVKQIANLLRGTPHDTLWLNSFFDPLTIKALLNIQLRSITSISIVVAPRGEFSWASLKQKYPKKLAFLLVARLFGLYRNVTWHASSEAEAMDIVRVMKIRRDAILVSNEFPIKSVPETHPDTTLEPSTDPRGSLRVISLSRIAREKNLDYGLRILGKVKASVMFDIYGPTPDRVYWKECQALISQLPSHITVNYLGSVAPDEVIHVFSRYDLFLFPTGGECYGHVIAECLTAGTPVLLSTHTPWRNLRADGLGWDIELEQEDAFVEAIEHVSQWSSDERRERQTEIKAKSVERLLAPAVAEAHRKLFKPVERMSRRNHYAICANCIMDTTDSGITFDARGWCDYCNNYYRNIFPNWHTDERGEREIRRQVERIKLEGKGRDHDCLLGVSGGSDSSYLAFLAKEKFGLRPLIFHVDAGWNSQQAVSNIEKVVDGLALDLHTEVVDWLEMKDLQLAFFKAQVPHLDTPQDHAIFASLYNFAAKHGIHHILTGANYSTECVREPLAWHYHATDLRQLKDIHRRFGTRPLKTFPMADIFTYKIYYRYVKGVRVLRPLNFVPYVKEQAMQELVDRFGWQRYAHKHYESRFTRFYEGYWLPTKFGYDKRRAHFSSLILTKQMTREEALERISKPAYDESTIAQDFEYIATKLDLSVTELQALLHGQNKSYHDYKSAMPLIHLGTQVLRALGVQRAIIR